MAQTGSADAARLFAAGATARREFGAAWVMLSSAFVAMGARWLGARNSPRFWALGPGRPTEHAAPSPSSPRRPPADPARLWPLIWLHVPKCGSSFLIAIAHLACGIHLEKDFEMLEPGMLPYKGKQGLCFGYGKELEWTSEAATTCRWNAWCHGEYFARFEDKHRPLWLAKPSMDEHSRWRWGTFPAGKPYGILPSVNDTYLGKVVAMFRVPAQRVISSWHYMRRFFPEQIPTNFTEYSRAQSGCATQMIVGALCGMTENDGEPHLYGLDEDEAKAIVTERLRRFGFVGITDRWALTVCLFHTMFGGSCLPVEFTQMRPGTAKGAHEGYNVSAYGMKSFEAIDDHAYAVAVEVFEANLAKYRVDTAWCRRLCSESRDQFPT